MLKIRPDDFRAMSPGEFMLALDGIAIANGTYNRKQKMTWNDVLEMEAKLCPKQLSKS